jgi:hypothetical protein
VPAISAGAFGVSPTEAASEFNIRRMRIAYGRAASACCCARRNFDAATIFIADVIFCVDLTLAIRIRSAFKLGMRRAPYANDFAKLSRKSVNFFSVSGFSSPSVRIACMIAGSLVFSSVTSPCSNAPMRPMSNLSR